MRSRDEDDIGENKFWLIIWAMVIVGTLTLCAMGMKCHSDGKRFDLECQKMGGKVGRFLGEPDCMLPEKK
jgi:hypothetical protein